MITNSFVCWIWLLVIVCLSHLFIAHWFEIWNAALPSSFCSYFIFIFIYFFFLLLLLYSVFGYLSLFSILAYEILLKTAEVGDSNLEGWDRKKMQGFYANSSTETRDDPHLLPKFLPWGLSQFSQIICAALPVEIRELCEKFRDYLLRTRVERRLFWQTNMDAADSRTTLGRGQKHKLSVQIHQMCTLMSFNNADRLNYKETE